MSALPIDRRGRVVVPGERAAEPALRRGERVGMPVVGLGRRLEDHHPIGDRCDALHRLGGIRIPQFEVPTELVLPVLVEVEEDVEPTVGFEQPVLIEVDVDVQRPAPRDLVESATRGGACRERAP